MVGEQEETVRVARLTEFVATVAVLTREAAQLATALEPRSGGRADHAARLARDAVGAVDEIARRGARPEEAVTTAIWALGLAAIAITEAKAGASAAQGRVHVRVSPAPPS